MSRKLSDLIYPLALVICAGLVISRIWVAEDAYISFRSIENFYSGIGLVFNQSQRIEASTHPLWMILLITIRTMGLALHPSATLLGLFFSGSGLLILYNRDRKNQLPIPITILLLCTISGFRDFATAGMEYSLVIFLMTLLFTSIDNQRLSQKTAYHATLLGLLYLARPELALLYIYYSLIFLWELVGAQVTRISDLRILFQKNTIQKSLLWFFGFLLTAGAYHLFRWIYYNDLFPNTYYAKAGLSSYYSQGIKYLLYSLLWSPSIGIVAVALACSYGIKSIRQKIPVALSKTLLRDLLAALIVGFYIIRVGGDFMSFRFLLPEFIIIIIIFGRVTPILWEHLKTRKMFYQHPGLLKWIGLGTITCLAFWPVPLYKGYIADERRIFTNDGQTGITELFWGQDHYWGQQGRRFGQLAACLGVDQIQLTNSMTQAKCMEGLGLGYFGVAAGPQVFILDEQALPNRSVAELPVLYRWRPGHEHYLDLNFVIQNKSMFCSTGEPIYDRIMQTGYGTLISLNPEILATIPDITQRLKDLNHYKAKYQSPALEKLEAVYNTKTEWLLKESLGWQKDSLMISRHKCWEPGF